MGMEVDDLLIDLSASIADVVIQVQFTSKKMLFDHTFSKRVMLLSVTYLLVTTLMMRLRVVSRLQQPVNTPMPITFYGAITQVPEERWYCYSFGTN